MRETFRYSGKVWEKKNLEKTDCGNHRSIGLLLSIVSYIKVNLVVIDTMQNYLQFIITCTYSCYSPLSFFHFNLFCLTFSFFISSSNVPCYHLRVEFDDISFSGEILGPFIRTIFSPKEKEEEVMWGSSFVQICFIE